QSVPKAARWARTTHVNLILLKRAHKDRVVPLGNEMGRAQRLMTVLRMNADQSGLICCGKNRFKGVLKVCTGSHRKCPARGHQVAEQLLPKVLSQRFKRQR